MQMKSFYYLDLLLKEIGKRVGLSLKEIRYLLDHEIKEVLLKRKINKKEIKARMRYSVTIQTYKNHQSKYRVLTGEKARKKEEELFGFKKKKRIDDFQGVCASLGVVIGQVKKLIYVSDIKKVRKGDIVVASMTTPEFVPALKKAGGIVTDEGGVTCHAAIISRELGIPCVVGTKIATKVLKDKDLIEIRAHHGVVKIKR